MAKCVWADICIFFNEEVGFSPEMNQTMRERFCLGDSSGCARLEALDILPLPVIPEDLIPTENDRLKAIFAEYRRQLCEGN